MNETRKLAAILAADVVGFSRLAGRRRGRHARAASRAAAAILLDPTIAVHHGRVVKRTGDGLLVEFRSVVDAVRCAIEIQNGMVERNAGVAAGPAHRVPHRRSSRRRRRGGRRRSDGRRRQHRRAARGIADPGGICLSDDAYRQVRDKVKEFFVDLGEKELKNIARPVRVYAQCETGRRQRGLNARAARAGKSGPPHLSIVVLPFANIGGDANRTISSTALPRA